MHCAWLFAWVLEIQTQIPMPASQACYQLSHLLNSGHTDSVEPFSVPRTVCAQHLNISFENLRLLVKW